jgi:uridine kinase
MERAELLDQLASRIADVPCAHPLRVAFDGVDATGKTTLAGELAACLHASGRQIIRASIDRFHRPRQVRYRHGKESPLGYYEDSFDLPALRRMLLEPLGPGGRRTISTALFDFVSDSFVEDAPFQAEPDAILLFDGVFLQRPELAGLWDLTIFIDVSFETVLARVIIRDSGLIGGEQAVRERYNRRYIPAQRHYLETCHPAEQADIVVINDDITNPLMIEKNL